ncbi:response regulator transcription factor [Synechococcus sp. CCY9201]|jgi:DNA-binding NarL/FixJ family response regulator|uniref:response regulator transcription factor n=1 Tax=unclassified Synechococcus TaxID=2626047 RepID=UPI0019376F81|nr:MULTISPECIES: response regulator transcription factor [unclassified Synechococcus]MEA5474145.1 response regulator transcription factor [Synechococcus sp. CCY9201]QPN60404.1 response regulator transcription factor [Synechococcus sp. CBW1002]CAK6689260.1 Sensor histidine kinase RcsC [Synechococcus sp. CBW1107]
MTPDPTGSRPADPHAAATSPAGASSAAAGSAGAASAEAAEPAPQAPARLLLVDDEPGLRTAVKAYLEDEGFVVTTANDGEEGWTLAQELLPDVIISDVMMPRLDGYGLLQRLRGDERLGGTPVIFLTAKGMTADRIAGFNAGADDYIPKPFDPDELVARVHNAVRRQERLLAEAARFADADIGQMAKQITEIRSLLSSSGSKKPPAAVRLEFTPREASVLQLVAEGLMNKEIARRLETSIRNVEKYVSRLFTKTGTSSRTELVRYALEHGLVE